MMDVEEQPSWDQSGFFVQMVSLGRPYGERTIEVPDGAKVLHIDLFGDEIGLWLEIEMHMTHPDTPRASKKYLLLPDGTRTPHDPDEWDYVGSLVVTKKINAAPPGVIIPAGVANNPNATIVSVQAVHVYEHMG